MSGGRAFGLALALACAQAGLAQARGGFVADIGLGVGEANFDLDTEDDEGDTGMMFGFDLGYAFQNGFALSGGLSATAFAYELQIAGEPSGVEYSIALTMFEFCAWYFAPLSERWELFGRAGAGPTRGTTTLKLGNTKVEDENESTGLVLGAGANFFPSEQGTLALQAEIFHRRFGLEFKDEQLEGKEVYTTGLAVGVRWR